MKTPIRRDIQGLRALAVTMVVSVHVFHWPSGGFLGVDVFFVISGFLITGILIREVEATGSVSFRSFYARRVRRILPAAVLVLVATVGVASVLWFPVRAMQTFLDAVWSALFMSNWHFAVNGSDYFATDAPSPLLHYWSLAVEEQFYAFWPLLVFAIALSSRRLCLRLRPTFSVMTVLMILGSLAWAAWRTSVDPQVAYFDSLGRAWELLAGAVIAIAGPIRSSMRVRRLTSALGLALIFGSALIVHEAAGVPLPWAMPAVVGVSLVIWSNVESNKSGLLGNRFSQWVGGISYSLYLWHFPVIVFAQSMFGGSIWTQLVSIPVMLSLAALSKRWVEEPFQHGQFLRNAARTRNVRPFVARDFAVGLVAVVLIASLVGVANVGPKGPHDATAVAKRVQVFETPMTVVAMASAEERQSAVTTALNATTWPDSMRQFSAWEMALGSDGRECMNSVFGDSPKRWCGEPDDADVLVVGDSVSMSWLPAITDAAAQAGLSTAGIGYGGCQLAAGLEYSHPSFGVEFPARCASIQRDLIAEVQSLNPRMLVLTGHPGVLGRLDSEADDAAEIWAESFSSLLDSFSSLERIFVLEANPWNEGLASCLVTTADPVTCEGSVDQLHLLKSDTERAAVSQAGNAEYIATRDWFCADGRCPVFVDDTLVTADGLHLTTSAGEALTDLLGAQLAFASR